MVLSELKTYLEITDTTRDSYLQTLLDTAIQKLKSDCNRDFLNDDGVLVIPIDLKKAISILVQGMDSNEAIQSDGITGGMNKTLREGGYQAAYKQYIKPYRRVKVI